MVNPTDICSFGFVQAYGGSPEVAFDPAEDGGYRHVIRLEADVLEVLDGEMEPLGGFRAFGGLPGQNNTPMRTEVMMGTRPPTTSVLIMARLRLVW